MMKLQAEQRTITGKQVAAIREQGKVPAVVYGKGIENESLSVPYADFLRIWRKVGESSLIEINTGEKKHNVLISDVQLDPITNTPVHVDFHAVRMDEKITASVPIEFEGEAPAVKKLGGVLVKVMHEVEVEALPAHLPNELIIDVSNLERIEDRITAGDIRVAEGVTLNADAEEVVALVTAPKEEQEEEQKTLEDIEVEKEKKEGEEGEKKEPVEEKKEGEEK